MQPNSIAREVERLLAMPYALRRVGDGLEISIPMRGARAQDIAVAVEGNTVDVSLRVEHELVRGAPGVVTEERHLGMASRVFTLAEAFDSARARAVLDDGVLHIHLSPGGDGRVRRLSIERTGQSHDR